MNTERVTHMGYTLKRDLYGYRWVNGESSYIILEQPKRYYDRYDGWQTEFKRQLEQYLPEDYKERYRREINFNVKFDEWMES